MIYSIQRMFTRADKKALLEYYKATRGLMRSPETVRNLSARDHFTFKRLADQFDSGIGNVDPKLAKEFFERLGMKHMASDAEHLIKKYGNEELARRYQRVYQKKRQKMMEDPLSDFRRLKEEYNLGKRKGDIRLDPKYLESKKQYESGWNTLEGRRERLMDLLIQKKRDERNKLIDLRSSQSEYFKNNPNLRERMMKRVKRRGSNYVVEDAVDNGFYNPVTRTIHIRRNENPYIIGHEDGHRISEKTLGIPLNDKTEYSMAQLADEAGASAHSISTTRKEGATKEQEQMGKDLLIGNFDTYLRNSTHKFLFGDLSKKYRGI